MTPTRQGSFHLFRAAGVDVFLHWSWFAVGAFEVMNRANHYSTFAWNALEYLSLFAIVLMHEFGHALACRQVGGQANEIVLWPLGGVAYVAPPPRPGATLWSIAAGPLVNVALVPVLTLLLRLSKAWDWPTIEPNAHEFIRTLWMINTGLLIFNLMPVYPLDGGQILRSLLWFVFGRARSLMIASIIGLVGVAALIAYALHQQSPWIGIIAAFILMNCWRGLSEARALARLAARPRHQGLACPVCHVAPPIGDCWICGGCRKPFDAFTSGGICPHCAARFNETRCLECGSIRPILEWDASIR